MKALRLGTRGSALALWQANHIAGRLKKAHPGLQIELVRITTQGDLRTNIPLSKIGGKGLFVKEIEEALLERRIDLAVHSLKDMPGDLPHGLSIACVPPREDARDALIGRAGYKLKELPPQATVGTSSLRRVAQLRHQRPNLQIVSLRGNIDTRLRRLQNGDFDAILLAYAGLKRLGLSEHATEIFAPDTFVPAVGQGALAIEARADNAHVLTLLAPLHDADTADRVAAERAFLRQVEGGCQVPIAAHATIDNGVVILDALIAAPDGSVVYRAVDRGPRDQAVSVGERLANRLLYEGGKAVLDACKSTM